MSILTLTADPVLASLVMMLLNWSGVHETSIDNRYRPESKTFVLLGVCCVQLPLPGVLASIWISESSGGTGYSATGLWKPNSSCAEQVSCCSLSGVEAISISAEGLVLSGMAEESNITLYLERHIRIPITIARRAIEHCIVKA